MALAKSLFQQNRRHPLERLHSSSSAQDLTCEYASASPVVCLAAHESGVCALVAKQTIELLSLDSTQLTPLGTCKANQYIPTRAKWQPRGAKLAVADSSGSFHLYTMHPPARLLYSRSCANTGRALRSLSFCNEQPQLLLTAGSDGSTKLWDLRTPLKQAMHTFARAQDVARECAFQPRSELVFATIYDSGVVQRWDIRARAPDVRLNAHQQGLSLTWHPTRNVLASGGRDRLAHVWNMDRPSEKPEYSVQTPSTVSQLHWLPACDPSELHVGSHDEASLLRARLVCAGRPGGVGVLRQTYSVYELGHPYVPLYTVETHTGTVTDLAVVGPHLVVSAGADSRVVQTDLRYEPLVQQNLAPAVVAWPSWDTPAVSVTDKVADEPLRRQSSPGILGGGSGASSVSGTLPMGITPRRTPLMRNSVSPVSLSSSPTASTSYGSPSTPSFLAPPAPSRRHSAFGSSALPTLASQIPDAVTTERYVAEIELPLGNESVDATFSQTLLFTRKPAQSFPDACRQNAETMLQLEQFKLAEMWQMLRVAISDSEARFLERLPNTHERQLARQWFAGEGDCEEPVLVEEELALFDDEEVADDDADWLPSMSTRRARRSTCATTSSTRTRLHFVESDAFRGVKTKYRDFVHGATLPWDLLPLLRAFLCRVVSTGSYITATALLTMFRHLPFLYERINAREIMHGGVLALQRNSAWVSATSVLKLLPLIKEIHWGLELPPPPDLVCHRCLHSLRENAASSQETVQLWYCARCRAALDGCSLCMRVIRGLCRVILECGHRVHLHCWDAWKLEGIGECPSGCGQRI